jgi:magnesium transporter
MGKIKKLPADYLLYSLLDCIIDNNFLIIEQVGDKIEQIDKKIIAHEKDVNAEIYLYKTEIAYLRKTIRPLKEMMTRLLRADSNLIKKESIVYFQELNDLIEQSIDAVDTYQNMVNDQLNHYNTNISNQANAIMKFLTIFASIFIPLTFIAGIYGMNFTNMPELNWKYGYFAMWGIMISVAGVMLYNFKRNKWF